jgi:hypothetical protein
VITTIAELRRRKRRKHLKKEIEFENGKGARHSSHLIN